MKVLVGLVVALVMVVGGVWWVRSLDPAAWPTCQEAIEAEAGAGVDFEATGVEWEDAGDGVEVARGEFATSDGDRFRFECAVQGGELEWLDVTPT